MSEYLLEVEHLKQYFPVRTGFMKTTPLKAVDDVSFKIRPGETLGLVGESGCGKTTVGRTLLRLYEPTGGRVIFDGEEVNSKNINSMRKKMQISLASIAFAAVFESRRSASETFVATAASAVVSTK